MIHIDICSKELLFKKPATTSRGTYTKRKSWFITLSSDDRPGHKGIGECAPLPYLSCDDLPISQYEKVLNKACQNFVRTGQIDTDSLCNYPSILFGLETAILHFEKNRFSFFDTPFSRGEAGIPINGLIWMDTYENMLKQVE